MCPAQEASVIMMKPYFELRDVQLDRLRTACAAMGEAVSQLPATNGPAAEEALRARWAELVELLALGPSRELRECPACGRFGMRDATRCGYCWTALESLDTTDGDTHNTKART
jgi:hypothetical protein